MSVRSTLFVDQASINKTSDRALEPVYFHALTQIRIWPALLVLIAHVEFIKAMCGVKHIPNAFLFAFGHHAVSFFFVLSGFLLTYLMLSEYRQTGGIDIPKFFMRRILRVWPLYFLVIAIAYLVIRPFLMPSWAVGNAKLDVCDVACFIGMIPNLVIAQTHVVHGAAQTWFVGVEQQFCLFWPLLFLLFRRNPLVMMVGVIGLKLLILTLVESSYFHSLINDRVLADTIWRLVSCFDIEGLAVGGIGAFFLLTKPESMPVRVLSHSYGWVLCLLPLAFLIPLLPSHKWIIYFGPAEMIPTLAYAGLIVHLASKKESAPISLFDKTLSYLGTISFGIYMYQFLAIFIMVRLLSAGEFSDINYNILMYSGTIGLTILFSILSNRFFESWFLKRKGTYSTIRSAGA